MTLTLIPRVAFLATACMTLTVSHPGKPRLSKRVSPLTTDAPSIPARSGYIVASS